MARFHESGLICDVDVISDTSDSECERYRLRVVNVIQQPSFTIPPFVGDEFDVCGLRDSGCCSGMWHLFGYDRATKTVESPVNVAQQQQQLSAVRESGIIMGTERDIGTGLMRLK